MKRLILYMAALSLLLPVLLCAGCGGMNSVPGSWQHIAPEEAAELMKSKPEALILDVRRPDEFEGGHIPGAVCLPNEEIQAGNVRDTLPDRDRLLLVYCRSGRRSREAAEKLAALGYTRVYEFGGILDWTGEIVTE